MQYVLFRGPNGPLLTSCSESGAAVRLASTLLPVVISLMQLPEFLHDFLLGNSPQLFLLVSSSLGLVSNLGWSASRSWLENLPVEELPVPKPF